MRPPSFPVRRDSGLDVRLADQALLLAATLLTGLALGALYELLRVLRSRGGRLRGLLLDLLFALCFGAALFLLGMGPGEGRLRLYMPPLAVTGMALWFALFGAATRRGSRVILDTLERPVRSVQEKIKNFFKKLFSFLGKWFTIIKNRLTIIRSARKTAKEKRHETETRQHLYEDRDSRADRLRLDQSHRRAGKGRKGRRGSGRASGAGGRAAAGKRRAGV